MRTIITTLHQLSIRTCWLLVLFGISLSMAWAEDNNELFSAVYVDVAIHNDTAVAVGERGYILVSEDKGEHWQRANSPSHRLLTAVTATPDGQFWAVGHDRLILSSTDQGRNWQVKYDGMKAAADQSDEQGLDPFLDVHFIDEKKGFAIGSFGLIFRTIDAGDNWHNIAGGLPNEDELHLNQMVSDQEGYIYVFGEAGLFVRSPDKGQTWQKLDMPYEGTFNGALVTPGGDLIAYGLQGHIFISHDRGEHWQEMDLGQSSTLFGATMTDDGSLFLVGTDGLLAWAEDVNQPFSSLHQSDRLAIGAVVALADNRLLLAGMGGIVTKSIPLGEPSLTMLGKE